MATTAITQIKIKNTDGSFTSKNIGVTAENVKCKFPIYNVQTGEETGTYETISLLNELTVQRNYRDSMHQNIDYLLKIFYDYQNIYTPNENITFNSSNVALACFQFKLYNQLLPLFVIDSFNKNNYSIYYSVISENNKIDVFSTLTVSTESSNEDINNNQLLVSLKSPVYYQTDLTTGTISKLTGIADDNLLQIVQVNALIRS